MKLRAVNTVVLLLAASCVWWILADAQRPERERRPDADAAGAVQRRAPAIAPAGAGGSDGQPTSMPALATASAAYVGLEGHAAALSSPDLNARIDAVSDLGQIDGEPAAALLARIALYDANPSVRAEGLHAIGDRRAEASEPVLARALADGDAGVRKAAISAIENARTVNSIPMLALALQDRDASVRATAVDAIAEIGGDGARSLLESMLADPSTIVREAAAAALVRSTAGSK